MLLYIQHISRCNISFFIWLWCTLPLHLLTKTDFFGCLNTLTDKHILIQFLTMSHCWHQLELRRPDRWSWCCPQVSELTNCFCNDSNSLDLHTIWCLCQTKGVKLIDLFNIFRICVIWVWWLYNFWNESLSSHLSSAACLEDHMGVAKDQQVRVNWFPLIKAIPCLSH